MATSGLALRVVSDCDSGFAHSSSFALEVPSDGLRKTLGFSLSESMVAALFEVSNSQGLEISIILLVGFQEILRRYTGQTAITIEFRSGESASSKVTLDGNGSVRGTVESVQKATNTENVASLKGLETGEFSFFPWADGVRPKGEGPIHLCIHRDGSLLQGCFDYDAKRFPQYSIESLASHFEYLLHAALNNLDIPVGDLEILSESEICTLQYWNRTAEAYPQIRIDELIRRRAREARDKVAVRFGNKSLTYGSLCHQASQLAATLRAQGIGPETLVGISMDRCGEMVVALLAILEAGGAYLPLEPTLPADRIAFILEDAQPLLVITQIHISEKLSFGEVRTLCVDSLPPSGEVVVERETSVTDLELDNLVNVFYTSGSTGKPKGVEITHRSLTNFLSAMAREVPMNENDIVMATSALSFDVSAFEIFAPLVAGASVVIVPRSVATNGESLAELLASSGATYVQATPSCWRILLEAGWRGQPGLRMSSGGEPLDAKLARQLLDRGEALWNFYGPTECTVAATGRRITGDDKVITIGRPLANYKTYILDDRNKPVPVGAIGELWLGGAGVARGYLKRPDLTTAKFLPDAFSECESSRMYGTGDLARFLPDGQIELLGRADSQVKVRGYRIELEEIEALLDSDPTVRKSVVKVWNNDNGNQLLIAYVVRDGSHRIEEARLRDFARRFLPSYMVPAAFVEIETLPLTPSGKTDRNALPDPDALQLREMRAEPEEICGDLERKVLECWRSALRMPKLKLDDNFFDLGGHSLVAARLFGQIEAALGRKLPLGLLIELPTPRLLTQHIRQMDRVGGRYLVPMQTTGSLPPLYIVHHIFGDILLYRPLADCFAGQRPVFGVQAPVEIMDRPDLRSFELLASLYVEEMLKRQPAGPFHLAGFSTGGAIAFEIAQRLRSLGHEVGVLALLDAAIDAPGPRLSTLTRYRKLAVCKACKIAFKLKYELGQGPREIVMKRVNSVRLNWKVRALDHSSAAEQRKSLTMEQALLMAERSYRPKAYPGRALLIRFKDEARKFGLDPLMGWNTLIAAGLETADLAGNHVSGLASPKVNRVFELLSKHMERHEKAILSKAS